MEAVIAHLLNDFEKGKLSRRQLVQTLALVAVGSPVATAAAESVAAFPTPSAPSGAPWKTVYLDHISYAVSDYKKSVDFYSELMGWTVRNDNGTSQATLDINGIGGIIIRNARRPGQGGAGGQQQPAAGAAGAAPPTQPAQPARTDSAGGGQGGQGQRAPITGVINHISWGITPWDKEGVRAELVKRGLTPRVDDVGETFRSWHVRDPDGWDLQISNKTKDSPRVGGDE